jgi:23S rRNA maturation mini-RNase III
MKIIKDQLTYDKKTILKKAKNLREQIERESCNLQRAVGVDADVPKHGIPNIRHIHRTLSKINQDVVNLAHLDGQLSMVEEYENELTEEEKK